MSRTGIQIPGATPASVAANTTAIAAETTRASAAENTKAPKWQPSTAYTAGDVVQAPDGSIVKRLTSGTSGVSYASANWQSIDTVAGTQAQTELAATYAVKATEANLTTETTRATAAETALQNLTNSAFTTGLNSAYAPQTLQQSALASTMALRRPRRTRTLISDFDSGHGWTKANSGTMTDDTTIYATGTQSVKVALTASQATRVEKSAIPSFDLTTKSLAVLVYLSNLTNLSSIFARVGTSAAAAYRVDGLANPTAGSTNPAQRAGAWFWVTFDLSTTTSIGTPPAKSAITYLGFDVTATAGGSLDFYIDRVELVDKPTAAFPSGVLTFGFDDGYIDQYTTARPILDKYGYAATAHVIQEGIGATAGATYMGLDQLHALQDNNGWEIAAHATTFARHNAGFTALDTAGLHDEFSTMKKWLLTNGFSGADHLAYPLGYFNDAVMTVARNYFVSARTIEFQPGGLAMLPPHPAHMHQLRCRPIDSNITTATYTALMDSALANKSWLHLYTHRVLASGATGTQYSTANFTTIVDYAASIGIPVRTVGEVLSSVA